MHNATHPVLFLRQEDVPGQECGYPKEHKDDVDNTIRILDLLLHGCGPAQATKAGVGPKVTNLLQAAGPLAAAEFSYSWSSWSGTALLIVKF